MAVAPNGDVIACQSWLNGLSFGNLLKDDWEEIWNHKDCVKIRQRAILKKKPVYWVRRSANEKIYLSSLSFIRVFRIDRL